jgi:hypothetical protein
VRLSKHLFFSPSQPYPPFTFEFRGKTPRPIVQDRPPFQGEAFHGRRQGGRRISKERLVPGQKISRGRLLYARGGLLHGGRTRTRAPVAIGGGTRTRLAGMGKGRRLWRPALRDLAGGLVRVGLDIPDLEPAEFGFPQPGGEKGNQDGVLAFALEGPSVWHAENRGLVLGEKFVFFLLYGVNLLS